MLAAKSGTPAMARNNWRATNSAEWPLISLQD
jgi:hypothetical protein